MFITFYNALPSHSACSFLSSLIQADAMTANVLQPGCNAALNTSGLESCKRAGNGPI